MRIIDHAVAARLRLTRVPEYIAQQNSTSLNNAVRDYAARQRSHGQNTNIPAPVMHILRLIDYYFTRLPHATANEQKCVRHFISALNSSAR